MIETLFIYGSLRDKEVQEQLFGKHLDTTPQTLQGYKKIPTYIEGQRYATILPDPHHTVEGDIILVSEEELKKIDSYEYPEFQRKPIEIEGKKVWVYIFDEVPTEGRWR